MVSGSDPDAGAIAAGGENAKIFVVEDDHDIRESLLEVLRSGGYRADGASSSQEAISRLQEMQPKPYLILLDLRLPGQDGFEFREEQKRHPSIAEIPVVLLSADSQVKEMRERIGAIDHLKKPVDIEDLLDTVRRNCIV